MVKGCFHITQFICSHTTCIILFDPYNNVVRCTEEAGLTFSAMHKVEVIVSRSKASMWKDRTCIHDNTSDDNLNVRTALTC